MGQTVKLTTSHKDLLLLLGIIVAIIISLTTWFHNTSSQAIKIAPSLSPKNQTSQVVKKLGRAVIQLTMSVTKY
jgi:hypothetical protein